MDNTTKNKPCSDKPIRIRNANPPEFCTFPGCNRPHSAKGYCRLHYHLAKIKGHLGFRPCQVDGCKNSIYSKGICHAHYELKRRRGSTDKLHHKCYAPNCEKIVFKDYCQKHGRQLSKGIPFDAPLAWSKLGRRNHRWNGGVSEYQNHSTMKRIRKEIIKEKNGICQFCGKEGYEIHHLDENKAHQGKANYALCCTKCHKGIFHSKPRTNTKFIRLYGMTLKEIGASIGKSQATILKYHNQGRLQSLLAQKELISA